MRFTPDEVVMEKFRAEAKKVIKKCKYLTHGALYNNVLKQIINLGLFLAFSQKEYNMKNQFQKDVANFYFDSC